MNKEEILREIRRVADENGGSPPGIKTFERQTGIRQGDWCGVFWRSWGDAVREAGLTPNALTGRLDDDIFIKEYALLTREIGRFPVKADLQLAKRRKATFPSVQTYIKRFGSYAALRSRVRAWCLEQGDFADILPLLDTAIDRTRAQPPAQAPDATVGYVYLVKHGSRPDYKIGRTQNPIRREGEIRLQLPERIYPIHYIETDDPVGIESYWHNRFASKRKEGEWFALTPDDVTAFKKWRRIS